VVASAFATPAFGQTTPSPDPDPQIRPDPVTTQSNTTPSQRPATHTPAVRSAPQPASSGSSQAPAVTATAPRSSSPRVTVSARPVHPAPRASKPRRTRERTPHAAAVSAWRRLSARARIGPIFPPLGAARPDERSQAGALSLAAIALLLVVIAGGSLLRLTARLPSDLHRGRPA
jgi:hypothetical protein